MSISDIFKPTTTSGGGFCAAGRIETGYVQKNDTVLITPLNEYAVVKVDIPLECKITYRKYHLINKVVPVNYQ